MFFDDWYSILRILTVGTAAYVGLVVLLRVSRKRTLSKLNAFDLIVTVALGSTLATVLLDSSIVLAEGLTALALLIALQYVIAWLSVRSPRFQALVKAEPTLLMRDGRFLHAAMRIERITEEEILASLRSQGIADPADAQAVVLETDGTISILTGTTSSDRTSLANVVLPDRG
ncbi:MAG TPA: YetF domain-containing protein [Arenibaculum sp.]|nr:YetF domain-containing protein [Arenibaculum sp.]